MSIGLDRYSKKHPSPTAEWSFDMSSSLNSSMVNESMKHTFSSSIGERIQAITSSNSKISSKVLIAVPVVLIYTFIQYMLFISGHGYFWNYMMSTLMSLIALIYYSFSYITAGSYCKYFKMSVKDLS
jgi:hypothetical protein